MWAVLWPSLQFGEVFQTVKPRFVHRFEGIWWKDCLVLSCLWTGIFSHENIEGLLPPSKKWPQLLEITKVAHGRSGKVAFWQHIDIVCFSGSKLRGGNDSGKHQPEPQQLVWCMERGRAAPCLGESQLGFPKPSKPYWTLVGGLEHFGFSPIVGMMIQSDYIIFFRGVEATNQILNRRSNDVKCIPDCSCLYCMPSGCLFSSSATPGNAQCVVYYVNLCATCWGCITLVRGLSNYICAVVSDRCLFSPIEAGFIVPLTKRLNSWNRSLAPYQESPPVEILA